MNAMMLLCQGPPVIWRMGLTTRWYRTVTAFPTCYIVPHLPRCRLPAFVRVQLIPAKSAVVNLANILMLFAAILLATATLCVAQIHGLDETAPSVFAAGVSPNFTAQNIGPPFAHNFTFQVRFVVPILRNALNLTIGSADCDRILSARFQVDKLFYLQCGQYQVYSPSFTEFHWPRRLTKTSALSRRTRPTIGSYLPPTFLVSKAISTRSVPSPT